MYSFFSLESVCCFMISSNCCFLTCVSVSQEAGQVIWYSHLFQNFPQFIVIHTVKGFGIVNKAEIDVFLELSCFFHDPADVGNLISGSSALWKWHDVTTDIPETNILYSYDMYLHKRVHLFTSFIFYQISHFLSISSKALILTTAQNKCVW